MERLPELRGAVDGPAVRKRIESSTPGIDLFNCRSLEHYEQLMRRARRAGGWLRQVHR